MLVSTHRAPPPIRRVVRGFGERVAELGTAIVTAPLPARPDQFIEFYLRDRYAVSHDAAPAAPAPACVVVGPQSYRRTRLFMAGSLRVFTIHFQPGGFHALFGVPMTALVNQGARLDDVLGPTGRGLRDAILTAPDAAARIAAATGWIGRRLDRACPADAIERGAALLLRSGGRLRIDALAAHAALSDRQFTRRFERQVGLTPKLFARTVRLNAVLDRKARAPHADWTRLVYDAGYADQAHFVRDCRALAGAPPAAFFAEWAAGR